ncbi:RING finger protein 212B [Tenebrio molitor]|uniref:RING finger protein 212B n=1 Tax=Tenebrio molitor TaxID=7067 RepID=UPI003624A796
MSDWVHCNKCSIKYNNQTTFFLVECGHIFCQRCVEKIRISKRCIICNKNTNVLLLNKDVEQTVLDFFLPLETLLKKTVEVYKFQLQHRTTLYQNMSDKYNYAKKEYINCHNSNKHLMKENQMLRSLLRSAGKNPHRFTTSTPDSHTSENNFTFQNTSLLSSIPAQAGITSGTDNLLTKMYPGYPKRSHGFSSGSSQGPSPAQTVPLGYVKSQNLPAIHRSSMGTMRFLEELRRSGKSQ